MGGQAVFFAGWRRLFWRRRVAEEDPKRLAQVYTRAGCGLCVEAVVMLKEEGFRVELIDVEQDADLTDRYGSLIPVVVIDGKERFRGRVNRVLLRRIRNHNA